MRAGREIANDQLRTLAAFGLESDFPVLWQSDRGDAYAAALDRLLSSGAAFACHCTRAALAADGGIHRHCVAVAERGMPAIRFRVRDPACVGLDDLIHGHIEQDVASAVGDFVLRRADGPWAYQLAAVVDDAAQGITDVVRGADLLDSAPRQILLQRALGLPSVRYAHLPLVIDHAGGKLSKSLSALPVDPADPLPALRMVWRLLGQPADALAGTRSVASALSSARSTFDPAGIRGRAIRLPDHALLPAAAGDGDLPDALH